MSNLIGWALTYLTIGALAALALTEFIGARVPGFHTISDQTRTDIAKGDYRLFVAVLSLLLLSGIWWCFHALKGL